MHRGGGVRSEYSSMPLTPHKDGGTRRRESRRDEEMEEEEEDGWEEDSKSF